MEGHEAAQRVLEELGRLYELRELVSNARDKGFLERDEALRLVELLRSIVTELSEGEARLTLYLLDVVEEIVRNPGPLIRRAALEKFGREDVIPMPEILAKLLPEPPLLEAMRALVRGPFGGRLLVEILARRLGVSSSVVRLLLNLRLRNLVGELGYIVESLLERAEYYAVILEDYVSKQGLSRLNIRGELLSVLAEIVARSWLSMALGGPWREVRPVARQAKRLQYEFDAVALELAGHNLEVHVAEVELLCQKFLKREKEGGRTRLAGKIGRLKRLLEEISEARGFFGARGVCLGELLLICYDEPTQKLREEVLNEASRAIQDTLSQAMLSCPTRSSQGIVRVVTAKDMIRGLHRGTPHNRLRDAIREIMTLVQGTSSTRQR